MARTRFTAGAGEDGRRLDQVVAERCSCSRADASRFIDAGNVRYRGQRSRGGVRVESGAEIDIDVPDTLDKRPVAEPAPLEILLEDESVVAVNKPANMPTHPLRVGERGTLANAIAARFPECADASDDVREGGAAHRLDTDTSGVILFARSHEAWSALRGAFGSGQVNKEYLALVVGHPRAQVIDAALAHAGKRVRVRDDGQAATTTISVLEQGEEVALIRAITSTGRMHQVRAHLAHVGHPLVGDVLYGGPPAPTGHLLHAWKIDFPHPKTGKRLSVEARSPAWSKVVK